MLADRYKSREGGKLPIANTRKHLTSGQCLSALADTELVITSFQMHIPHGEQKETAASYGASS
jgi:hypothetical protein